MVMMMVNREGMMVRSVAGRDEEKRKVVEEKGKMRGESSGISGKVGTVSHARCREFYLNMGREQTAVRRYLRNRARGGIQFNRWAAGTSLCAPHGQSGSEFSKL